MARFKYIDTSPRFIAIDLQRQWLPGTFEHAVNQFLEHAIDLSRFTARFRYDATGAPAYPSKKRLRKDVLVACAHGIVSSRAASRPSHRTRERGHAAARQRRYPRG